MEKYNFFENVDLHKTMPPEAIDNKGFPAGHF